MGTSPITRKAAGAVAGLLTVGALAAAGCGGSSSTSTTTPAAGTTPAGTTTTFGPHDVPASTDIASPDYYNALVQGFEKGPLSPSQAKSAAHCIQDGLQKAGFKTQGDAEGANTKEALQVILPCVQKAKNQ